MVGKNYEDYNNAVPQGQAIVIPTYPEQGRDSSKDWSQFNEGKPITYLISAPTMRVPVEVPETVNAYLAFRAVVLAGLYTILVIYARQHHYCLVKLLIYYN